MSDELIKKEDLFNVIKHGTAWINDKIKTELEKIIAKNTYPFINSSFRWDSDDKYYYIYENECYLFIFDGIMETRCDREMFTVQARVLSIQSKRLRILN